MINKRFLLMFIVFVIVGCSNEEITKNDTPQPLPPENEIPSDTSTVGDKYNKPMDSVEEEAYKNDLSLEIKPIKEEIEDPISAECSQLLEEYASVIREYNDLLKKIDDNPDDFNLMIAREPQQENLESYSTKPQFFNCQQNKAFKKQFDILNEKKDKLLYN